MKYPQMYDGDWVQPRMTGFKMRCCSCSLIHNLKFKIIKDDRGKLHVLMQANLDKRATSAARRKKKK